MIKHTSGGGISFKKVGRFGIVSFLIIHTTVLAGIFALRYLGFATDLILVIAGVAISLEAIYLSFFAMTRVNKTVDTLKEIERGMTEFHEDALEIVKIHRALLYIGHQIKTIQTDLDGFKKSSVLKAPGNGHYKRAHS